MKSNYKKSTKVLCDNCGRFFDIGKKIVKLKMFGDLEAEYFICPHCKQIYLVIVTDSALRLSIKMHPKVEQTSIQERAEWLKAKYGAEIMQEIQVNNGIRGE